MICENKYGKYSIPEKISLLLLVLTNVNTIRNVYNVVIYCRQIFNFSVKTTRQSN